jgi:SAM-dependent methyltransferase
VTERWKRFARTRASRTTRRLLELAAARRGERVVDIGCGAGVATALLAERVGSTGRVVGIDVSPELIAMARERGSRARFVVADAAAHRFAPHSIDLAVSEFGVTFFREPVQAFARFRRALAPGGRLVFSCYGAHNAWLQTIFVAAHRADRRWQPPDLERPGPFAFVDRARVAAILAAAGFTRVTIAAGRMREPLGRTRAAAVDAALARPYIAAVLAPLDAAALARVRASVSRALPSFETARGYAFPATVWYVTARS